MLNALNITRKKGLLGRKNYSSIKNVKLIKYLGTNKFVPIECLLGRNKFFVHKKYKSNKTFRDEIILSQ